LLELSLALGLAVLSVAFLVGVVLAGLYLQGPVGDDEGSGGRPFILGSFCLAVYVLKHPWAALLRYYRYDVQTLRPLAESKTEVPGDRREKNEG
jgi:hypothetical protein